MVDTSDEWIMQRIGIKNEDFQRAGKSHFRHGDFGSSATSGKTKTHHDDIDLLIVLLLRLTVPFLQQQYYLQQSPAHNAWSFDLNAACSGFLFSLATGASFIESGRYKKVVIVAADMMSSITDYNDRTTCRCLATELPPSCLNLQPEMNVLKITSSYDGKDAIISIFGQGDQNIRHRPKR
jgi:3-oxoacyl-[acyl-carrier-protein] synthase-3